MTIFVFAALVFAGSVVAGLLGALTGLGGGVVLVPLLTLALGVDIHYAIGASLVSVIATSSGAAVAYLREGFTNMRVGMFLELATTLGATGGALLGAVVAPGVLAVLFGLVLLSSVYFSAHRHSPEMRALPSDRLALRLRMEDTYPDEQGEVPYHVRHVPVGFGLMALAGALSGLLGIGSGAMKVLAMDRAMGLPFKVSTTTSNFMIGVTAAASAGVYLNRGYIDPGVAMPTMLGVLIGSLIGARFLPHMESRNLRLIFAVVIFGLAVEMIFSGLTGEALKMALDEWARKERREEWAIAALLRAGVGLAAAVVLGGGIYYLFRHGAQAEPWSIFRGEPADLRDLAGILRDALVVHTARGIIQVGLLLLILTPIARVAFSAVVFWREKDRTYVAITLGVLAVLLYNLLLGWR